jgi:hypothetical protein
MTKFMITVPNPKYQWIAFELYQKALAWCQRMRRRMRTASKYSSWWSFDKVQAMSADAVNPAKIQRYLSLWASWWAP